MFFILILTALGTNRNNYLPQAGMQQALKLSLFSKLASVTLIKEPLLSVPWLLSGLVVYCPFEELSSLENRQLSHFMVLSPANLRQNYRFNTHLTWFHRNNMLQLVPVMRDFYLLFVSLQSQSTQNTLYAPSSDAFSSCWK